MTLILVIINIKKPVVGLSITASLLALSASDIDLCQNHRI